LSPQICSAASSHYSHSLNAKGLRASGKQKTGFSEPIELSIQADFGSIRAASAP
jgi:superoxide dismutase